MGTYDALEAVDVRELWGQLDQQVRRLVETKQKGISLSEDFAVDRVCGALARLRQNYCPADGEAAITDGRSQNAGSGPGGGQEDKGLEELVTLRVALAADEQRLRLRQAKLDEVLSQANKARASRLELDQEFAKVSEVGRREADACSRQLKETQLRAQLCQARLKATEQEVRQLQTALAASAEQRRPPLTAADDIGSLAASQDASASATLSEAWKGLVSRLQAELEAATAESAQAAGSLSTAAAPESDTGAAALSTGASANLAHALVRGLTPGLASTSAAREDSTAQAALRPIGQPQPQAAATSTSAGWHPYVARSTTTGARQGPADGPPSQPLSAGAGQSGNRLTSAGTAPTAGAAATAPAAVFATRPLQLQHAAQPLYARSASPLGSAQPQAYGHQQPQQQPQQQPRQQQLQQQQSQQMPPPVTMAAQAGSDRQSFGGQPRRLVATGIGSYEVAALGNSTAPSALPAAQQVRLAGHPGQSRPS
eukprot:TRINITY_DN19863_c0_g1_i1.p1 TRINITY_DN19863_c0_g1~~TRINITY_DN19863_c0_g1_i1.p1  ORF type:complete len:485 (+),score=127.49 TRINITY_DN19863_c0_g1_i1:124-1578(+)